jgi:hypothetical protein
VENRIRDDFVNRFSGIRNPLEAFRTDHRNRFQR